MLPQPATVLFISKSAWVLPLTFESSISTPTVVYHGELDIDTGYIICLLAKSAVL